MKKTKDNQPEQKYVYAKKPETAAPAIEAPDAGENAIRAKREDSNHTDLPFKKSLYGYDAADVKNYIDELNSNTLSVGKVYEAKINELKDELALCYRERDSFKEAMLKLKSELEQATAAPAPQASENSPATAEGANSGLESRTASEQEKFNRKAEEYEKTISELNTAIAKAENEIQRLTAFETQVSQLSDENKELSKEAASLKQKNNELKLELARHAEIAAAYDNIVAENERLKAETAAVKKSFDDVSNELNAKNDSLAALSSENEKLRIEVSETGIKYTVMCQQAEKAEAEAAELKDKNKSQAYEFAAKINEFESQHTKEKLNLQKNMQVNAYHIKQMNLLVQELSSQVEQVEKSFDETEILH